MTDRQIAVSNLNAISEKWKARARRAANLQPVLRDESVDILERNEVEIFASQGVSVMAPWSPLAQATIRSKINPQPLVESGAMMASFTQSSHPNAIRRYGKNSLEFGSNHPLAHLHQDGTKGGRMPARPVLKVTAPTRAAATKALRDYIMDGPKG